MSQIYIASTKYANNSPDQKHKSIELILGKREYVTGNREAYLQTYKCEHLM